MVGAQYTYELHYQAIFRCLTHVVVEIQHEWLYHYTIEGIGEQAWNAVGAQYIYSLDGF